MLVEKKQTENYYFEPNTEKKEKKHAHEQCAEAIYWTLHFNTNVQNGFW